LDALVVMPEGVGDGNKNVCVGVGDGGIRIVRLGMNKIVGEVLRHDEVEAVVALGFDVEGRLISGGGEVVKVWQEKMHLSEDDEDEDSDDGGATKRAKSDSDDSDAPEEADSSDEEEGRRRKKKRKRTKGKEKSAGNGILGFKGLE
jgi:WD repeat-containing protein 55